MPSSDEAPAASTRWPVDRFPSLPRSEADLKAILRDENYAGRLSLASKLGLEFRNDPSLLHSHLIPLLNDLLATSLLPDTVPLLQRADPAAPTEAEDDGFVLAEAETKKEDAGPRVVQTKLRHPQTNASLRFHERELGITVLSMSLPERPAPELADIVLRELHHPSMTAKARVVGALVSISGSVDPERLKLAFDECVPRVRRMCVEALRSASKWSVLDAVEPKADGSSWNAAPVIRGVPLLVQLREALSAASSSSDPKALDAAWAEFDLLRAANDKDRRSAGVFPFPISRHLVDPAIVTDPATKPFPVELLDIALEHLPRRTISVVSGTVNDASAPRKAFEFCLLPSLVEAYLPLLVRSDPLRTSELICRTMIRAVPTPPDATPLSVSRKDLNLAIDVPEGFVGNAKSDNFWKRRTAAELKALDELEASGEDASGTAKLGDASGTLGLKRVLLAALDAGRERHGLLRSGALEHDDLIRLLSCMRGRDILDVIEHAEQTLSRLAAQDGRPASWSHLIGFFSASLEVLAPRLLGTSKFGRTEGRGFFSNLCRRVASWMLGDDSIAMLRKEVSSEANSGSPTDRDPKMRSKFASLCWSRIDGSVLGPILSTFGNGRERYPAVVQSVFARLLELHRRDTASGISSSALPNAMPRILRALAPIGQGVYARSDMVLANDAGLEAVDAREPWSNAEAFEFAKNVRPMAAGAESLIDNLEWWTQLSKDLVLDQRLGLFGSADLLGLPALFHVDIAKGRQRPAWRDTVVNVLEMADGDRPAQTRVAEAWLAGREVSEMGGLGAVSDIASYLDISKAQNRSYIATTFFASRSFEDRILGIWALLRATYRASNPVETAATLQFLIPKLRNEIQPNLVRVPPAFYLDSVASVQILASHRTVAGVYLPDLWFPRAASREEQTQLAKLWLEIDANNLSAVTVVPNILSLLVDVASSCLSWCLGAGEDGVVAWNFVLELLWRRAVHAVGTSRAPERFRSLLRSSLLAAAAKDIEPSGLASRMERDEPRLLDTLRQQSRKAVHEGSEGHWGLCIIHEGSEAAFVDLLVEAVRDHYSAAGTTAFKDSYDYYELMYYCFFDFLGTRWSRVPAMVEFLSERLNVLRSAPLVVDVPDQILDWEKLVDSIQDAGEDNAIVDTPAFLSRLVDMYQDSFLAATPPAWYTDYSDLRLRSSFAIEEADRRLDRRCKTADGKIDLKKQASFVQQLLELSPSAVHLPFVSSTLLESRQDLLKDSFLTAQEGFRGLFNPIKSSASNPPPTFKPTFPTRLSPEQNLLLSKVYLANTRDPDLRQSTRVKAVESYTKLPTTTIHELAALLSDTSLPQRVVEAILMFLPSLDEPAVGIQILLSRYYLDSDLARTAIHVVKGALDTLPYAEIPALIMECFNAGDRPPKIAVQKELFRLVKDYMHFPETLQFVLDVWGREKLHRDVRIVLLQTMISLLNHDSAAVRDAAWSMVGDAIAKPALIRSNISLVLCAVSPAIPNLDERTVPNPSGNENYRNQIRGLPANPTLSELANQEISGAANVARWATEVLAPLTLLPVPEKEEDAALHQAVVAIRFAALLALINNGLWFADPTAAESLAASFASAAIEHALDETTAGQTRFTCFVYLVAQCVSWMPGPTAPQASMRELAKIVDHLSAAVSSSNPRTRRLAIQQLERLNLEANFLFLGGPEVERRTAGLDKLDLVSGLGDMFWRIKHDRRMNYIRRKELTAGSSISSAKAADLCFDVLRSLASPPASLESSWRTFLISQTTTLFSVLRTPEARTKLAVKLLEAAPDVPAEDLAELRFELLTLPDLRSSLPPTDLAQRLTSALEHFGLPAGEPPSPRAAIYLASNASRFAPLVAAAHAANLPQQPTLEDHDAVPLDLIEGILAGASRSPAHGKVAWDLLLAAPEACFFLAGRAACAMIAAAVRELENPAEAAQGQVLRAAVALLEFARRAEVEGAMAGKSRAAKAKEVGKGACTPTGALLIGCVAAGALAEADPAAWYVPGRDNGEGGAGIVKGAVSVDDLEERMVEYWGSNDPDESLRTALPREADEEPGPVEMEAWNKLAAALLARAPGHLLLNTGLLPLAGYAMLASSLTLNGWEGWEAPQQLGLDLVRTASERAKDRGDRGAADQAVTALGYWVENVAGKASRPGAGRIPAEEANEILAGAADLLEELARDSSPSVRRKAAMILLEVAPRQP